MKMNEKQRRQAVRDYIANNGVTRCPPLPAWCPAHMNEEPRMPRSSAKYPRLDQLDGDWGDMDYE